MVLLGTMAGAACASAQTAACPDTIAVRQELKEKMTGWEPFTNDIPLRLAYLTFYDGPPREKASLVNDSSKKEAGIETATWHFTRNPGRHIWVACSYSGTAIALVRELPAAVSSCTVTYNSRQHIAGMPQVEKFACK